jgi:ubiquinone biosynthesis protein Coq4
MWYETGLEQARTVSQMVQSKVDVPLYEKIPVASLPELPPGTLGTVY